MKNANFEKTTKTLKATKKQGDKKRQYKQQREAKRSLYLEA